MSSPRLRRLIADYENVMTEFLGHPHITVKPEDTSPPEVYEVIYRLPGLRLQGNNPVETNEHRVVFYLDQRYPQRKPRCEIKTPIFHPNFRSGIVCIGDHWSAGGETLADLIVKVGDMIQYKEYNLSSPMDAKAAFWAKENEHLLPISNIDLYREEVVVDLAEISEDWSIDIRTVRDNERHEDTDFEIEILSKEEDRP